MKQLLAVSVLLVACIGLTAAASAPTTLDITVPESTKVSGEDSYICITKPLPDKPLKLVGVEPMARQEVVHHILLFGCDEPFQKPEGGKEAVWECKHQPTCGGRQDAVLYGWGRNADKLELPKGVGFSVGKGTAVKWIVMQVHYLNEKPAGDNAGVRLSVQDTPLPYSAGMLSYASYFSIPPRKKQHYVLNHCCYRGFQPLTSFAVRVHTHTLGKQVFMTRAPSGGARHAGSGVKAPGDMVAIGNPQLPQGFYSTKAKVIWPGERLTVGCDFDSSNMTQVVHAGSDHNHEMCNMYLMVYASVAHIEMCSDGTSLVDELAPGNMVHAAKLIRDPYPLWKPPTPATKLEKGVFGNVASVALGPDGHVWVLSRGGRVWTAESFDKDDHITDKEPIQANVVTELHPDTGKILRQWGAGVFYMPHMLTVDRNNTVWVTDVGRHQALQFSASGKLLREIGTKMYAGHDEHYLCKPTQVAFLNDGSFLISDGYCNSRVMRYNPDGSYHSQYTLSANLGQQPMLIPHSLVIDECDNTLKVADRENKKVHTFKLDSGEFSGSKDMTAYGKVWALTKGPYGRTLALCWDEGMEARVVDVDKNNVFWTLPDSVKSWPHDFALGAAATHLSGAGDRMLALYVAPLCADCGPLEKYVLMPNGAAASLPAAEQSAQQQVVLPAGQRPPLAHAGSGYHAPQAAAGQPAAHDDGKKVVEEEQEQEEQALEAEAAEEEQDAEQPHDPQEVQTLKQQVAELQAKVAQLSGEAGGSDNEGFAVFHTKAHRSEKEGGGGWGMGGWGIPVLMVAAVVVIAGVVFVAYQKMSAQQRNALPVQHHPVGNGVLYQQSPTKDEDAEAITDRDTARLLRR